MYEIRRLAILGIASLLLSGCATTQTTSNKATQHTEVAGYVESYRRAMLDADGRTLKALSHPQLNFGHSNGVVQTRDEFIGSVVSGDEDFLTLKLPNRRIWVSGNTAIARHGFHSEINFKGKHLSVRLEVVEVWKKDRNWQLISRQAYKPAAP